MQQIKDVHRVPKSLSDKILEREKILIGSKEVWIYGFKFGKMAAFFDPTSFYFLAGIDEEVVDKLFQDKKVKEIKLGEFHSLKRLKRGGTFRSLLFNEVKNSTQVELYDGLFLVGTVEAEKLYSEMAKLIKLLSDPSSVDEAKKYIRY